MTFKLSTAVRNAELDAIEVAIGTSPVLKIFDNGGSIPANCAAADGASAVLATVTLPSDWLAAASGGAKSKSGTWEDTSADASGTVQHFRIYESTVTTCHMQGSVTITGGGGDMTVDSVTFTAGQDFLVTSFTLTAGNP